MLVRYHLIEIIFTLTNTNEEIMIPTTIKSHLLIIERRSAEMQDLHLNVLQGPIINCKKERLMEEVGNKINDLQSTGVHTNIHTVFSTSNLVTLS